MSKIVYVRLPEEQVKSMDQLIKNKLYTSRSSVIQEAVSVWLFDRGYIHEKKKSEGVTA